MKRILATSVILAFGLTGAVLADGGIPGMECGAPNKLVCHLNNCWSCEPYKCCWLCIVAEAPDCHDADPWDECLNTAYSCPCGEPIRGECKETPNGLECITTGGHGSCGEYSTCADCPPPQ